MNDHGLNIDLKRFSQTSANGDSELGLYRNDQHREKPEVDWETYGLQVAKLEKLEGWRLWVTITWYVETDGIYLMPFAICLTMVTNSYGPLAVSSSGSSCQAWSQAS